MEKIINYSDGSRDYNKANILEVKEYFVVDISKTEMVENEEQTIYTDRVWFPLNTEVFTLTPEEIELIQNPPEEEL